METSVLLSVKPEFAEQILSGEKRYEFRRALFKEEGISRVVLYASRPVQRIVGEFEIAELIALEKEELWRRTKQYAGIGKGYFDRYFLGKVTAFAISIKNVIRYPQPVPLQKVCPSNRPPQSFRYLRDG
jgi:predicted transcriptional regulator